MEDTYARIADKIRADGAVIDLRSMVSMYGPLHEREPYADIRVTRDLRYGPDPRHLADMFVAGGQSNVPRPVLIFVHGGGYIVGERRVRPDSPFHDNVGLWAARHGFIGIVMTYRLAPAAPWPAGAEDIAAAVAWAREAAIAVGGDPAAMFLMGHSAGATHISCYLSHDHWRATPGVRGAILLSSTFAATTDEEAAADDAPFVGHERQYFGHDPSHYPERAALPGLIACPVPLLVVSPEYDPPFFARHTAMAKAAFAQSGRADRFVLLAAHNHMSQILALNTEDTVLGDTILDFVAAVTTGANSACGALA